MKITENTPKKSIRDVEIGTGVIINDFTNLYECSIGDYTKIGTFVEIQRGVRIGERCKISSHTFICEGVRIEDEVFIGHGVCFINDKHPKSTNEDGTLKSSEDWTMSETTVEKGASIGTGATIMCGVRIGTCSLVGAGSVVTKDVPDYETVIGNPAKIMKKS